MRWLVAVLVLFGCAIQRSETTDVVLYDATKFAVELDTPSGSRTVMAAGAVRGEIPASVPPYVGSAEQGSWVERHGDVIEMWCPTCSTYRHLTLLDRRALWLDGNAFELLHFDGDELRIRTDVLEARPCWRQHRPTTCYSPKLRLRLATPMANVSWIHFDSQVVNRDPDTQEAGIVLGLAGAAGGLALGGYGLADHDHQLVETGAASVALGTLLFVVLLHELRARDEHLTLVDRHSSTVQLAP